MKRKAAIVGIVGTAKNTGKTSTVILLMERAYDEGISIGLTGIGYDGEEIDNITLLPKPRYTVRYGTLIATSEMCLSIGSAVIEILAKTGCRTPLGEVTIGRVKKAGTIVVAGPNKGEDLNLVIKKLKNLGAELLLVDGSINRIAPMIAVDALILAAGAAQEVQIDRLAQEVKCISEVFNLSVINHKSAIYTKNSKITVSRKGGGEKRFSFNSLLVPSVIDEIIKEIDDETALILIPGVVEAHTFLEFVRRLGEKVRGKTILFSDPTKLLISGNFDIVAKSLIEIRNLGGKVGYLRRLPLIAITINPFYPRYSELYQDYEAAYVDKDELVLKLSDVTHIPVIDGLSHDGNKLLWTITYSTLFDV